MARRILLYGATCNIMRKILDLAPRALVRRSLTELSWTTHQIWIYINDRYSYTCWDTNSVTCASFSVLLGCLTTKAMGTWPAFSSGYLPKKQLEKLVLVWLFFKEQFCFGFSSSSVSVKASEMRDYLVFLLILNLKPISQWKRKKVVLYMFMSFCCQNKNT